MKKKYISPKTRLIALDTEELMQQMLSASITKGAFQNNDPNMAAPMEAMKLEELSEGVYINYYPADPSIPQD